MEQQQHAQHDGQARQQNVSLKDENLENIFEKLETILEQSANSIRNYFRKRKIDIATINCDKNPLIIAIQKNYPIDKIHALMKNFSSINKKKSIKKSDIEEIKMEIELNKKIINIIDTNDEECLKHFLEKESLNLNFFKNTNNPLMYAIMHGKSFKIIEYLLRYNIEINFCNLNGKSPLSEAIIMNNRNVFNLLLKKGANVNLLNFENETPLLYVIKKHFLSKYFLAKFLEYNANVNIKDKNNTALLTYLTKANEERLVDFLLNQIIFNNTLIISLITFGKNRIRIDNEKLTNILEKGYSIIDVDITDSRLTTPLMYACQEGCYNIASSLLKYKADINKKNIGDNIPLFFSVFSDDYRITKLLLETGKVEINQKNKNGETALSYSCLYDHPEMVDLLVEYNANVNNVNNRGQYPVHLASINGKLNTLKALLSHGASHDVGNLIGNQCFTLACINENMDIAKYLLNNYKVNYNYVNYSGDSVLHQCFILKKKEMIKFLLELEDIQIDTPNSSGDTPFLLACKKNDIELIKLILDKNKPINYNAKNSGGDYALFFATYFKNLELMRFILDLKVDMYMERSFKSYNCQTPFTISCSYFGTEDMIKLFIEYGIDVNRPNSLGVYPIGNACKSDNVEHVRLLLEAGANPNVRSLNTTPLIQACTNNNLEMIKLLIENGADVNFTNIDNLTPLIFLVKDLDTQNNEIIKYLIEQGADLYCDDNYGNCLLYLVKNTNKVDKVEIYKILVDAYKAQGDYETKCRDTTVFIKNYDAYQKIKAEISDNSLINEMDLQQKFTLEDFNRSYLQACVLGDFDHVKFLLEHIPTIDINFRETNGDTPLIIACQTGKGDIAKYLLDHGADPNPVCECSNTALYVTSFSYSLYENTDLMKHLLDHGAHLNIIGQYSLSPLMVASKDRLEDVVQLFLQYNADVNIKDYDDNTALIMSCNRGNFRVVEILLENKNIDINVRSKDGYTALMISCNTKNFIITKALIENGADLYIKNNNDQTALQLACNQCFSEVLDLFFNHQNKMDLLQEDKFGFTPYHMIKLNGSVLYFTKVINYEIDYLTMAIKCYECSSQAELPEKAINYLGKEVYDQFDTARDSHPEILEALKAKLAYIEKEKSDINTYLELKGKFQECTLDLKRLSPAEINILLIYATIYLDVKIIYCLLEMRNKMPNLPFDINAVDQDGNSALHYISGSGRYEWDFINALIRFFLSQPDIDRNLQNHKGYTPLMYACYNNNIDVSRILIEYDVEINLTNHANCTALMMACNNRCHDTVKLLLKYGAEVNVQETINGETALTLACKFYYDYDIIKMLLEKGAVVNVVNKKGETPLILSCFTNNIKNIRLLVDHGADINVHDPAFHGYTPLMIVLLNFNYYLANYFIQHQVDLNMVNEEGESALILTCRHYNKYGSELLIESGIDVKLKDKKGRTAKDIINANGYNFIIGL